jgi:hypothetical protein
VTHRPRKAFYSKCLVAVFIAEVCVLCVLANYRWLGCVCLPRNHNQPAFTSQYLLSLERRRESREMALLELQVGGWVVFAYLGIIISQLSPASICSPQREGESLEK